MLRLAGLRIDPRTNGLHLAGGSFAITLVKLSDGSKIPVALPAKALAGGLRWSPDGNHFAFSNTTDTGIELWVGDPATGKTKKIEGRSEEHTSELQSRQYLVCRLLLEKKKT